MQYLTVGISLLALFISGVTLWLSHIRRGSLKMTKPTVVFFGPDGGEQGISKIFLRTLLYSTAKRGVVLENLYVRLRRGETQQNFNIWVYGEKDLARGSGLFIGQEGIATNHQLFDSDRHKPVRLCRRRLPTGGLWQGGWRNGLGACFHPSN